ncbi:MAG: NUDIX domain-containing protein [Actinomycetota bacterium]
MMVGDQRERSNQEGHAGRAGRASAELVEVVTIDGTVIDVVTRAEMRHHNLRHRCTYVAVLVGPSDRAGTELTADGDTELWVHKRASWKDTNPSFWDIAFGGVCDVGEDWHRSAERELAEEAGITDAPLLDLGSFEYDDATTRVLGQCFVAWWPEEPSCPDGEVVALERLRLADLNWWLGDHDVCADSVAAMVPRLTSGIDRDTPR